MKQYIGCDSHARYSVFVSVDEKGQAGTPVRVDHGGRGLRDYLATLEKGTPVAVEASGGWYWFMDELEKAGLDARLVNPLEAKHRMGGKNKTDKLDAKGLAILLRSGTLPEALDLTTPAGRAMAGLLSVFAEFEHEILRERIRAGIAEARLEGKRFGRPLTAAKKAHQIRKLHRAGVSKAEIARQLNIGRTSVRRILA